MPLYDYHCPACQHDFEDFRPMDEAEPPACPKCARAAQRCVSTVHYKTNPFPYKDALKKHTGPLTMPRKPMGGGCGGCGSGGTGGTGGLS